MAYNNIPTITAVKLDVPNKFFAITNPNWNLSLTAHTKHCIKYDGPEGKEAVVPFNETGSRLGALQISELVYNKQVCFVVSPSIPITCPLVFIDSSPDVVSKIRLPYSKNA